MRVILFRQRDAVVAQQIADHRHVHTLLREMRSERVLYVIDSQSSENQNAGNYNPGCKRGIRVGNAKDGKVLYYIPPPTPADPRWQPAIGVTVDRNGNIFAASDDQHNVVKWIKN